MEEVLEVVRREMKSASWYYDERSGNNTKIEEEAQQLMYERMRDLHAMVRAGQDRIKSDFLYIGACLAEIERDGLYHAVRQTSSDTVDDGYSNFYKFCKDVFGFKKRTAANLVMVYRKFCNDQGMIRVEYLNFSYTQLVELATMDDYRDRIPSTCSTRDIKRLKKLYKEYTPKEGTSYLDDLAEAERRHREALAEKNAEKNKIRFIPASSEERITENVPAAAPNIAGDEDEYEAVTPEREEKKPNTEAVIRGLLAQLELLKNSTDGKKWTQAADLFAKALQADMPDLVHSVKEVSALNGTVAAVKKENRELKQQIADMENEISELEEDNEVLREANEELTTRQEKEGASACTAPMEEGEILSGKLELKNKEARKEWLLHVFDHAKPWLVLGNLGCELYRYDFDNGAFLVWTQNIGSMGAKMTYYGNVDIVEKGKSGCFNSYSMAQVVDWLTRHAKEI